MSINGRKPDGSERGERRGGCEQAAETEQGKDTSEDPGNYGFSDCIHRVPP